jgi:hypothetical protein
VPPSPPQIQQDSWGVNQGRRGGKLTTISLSYGTSNFPPKQIEIIIYEGRSSSLSLSVQAQYSRSCPIISSSCYDSSLVT